MGAVAFHRQGWSVAEFSPERAARRRLPPCQSSCAGQGPEGRDGLHHHGARGHAADVGLERHLRRDRAARRRHSADAGARDALHPRGARRAYRGRRRMPRRQSRADHDRERALVRRPAGRAARSRGPGRAYGRYRLTAATVSSSSMRKRSASRSSPTKPATSPRRASGSSPPPTIRSASPIPRGAAGITSPSVSSPGR